MRWEKLGAAREKTWEGTGGGIRATRPTLGAVYAAHGSRGIGRMAHFLRGVRTGRDAPKDALDLQLSSSQELLTRIRILVTIVSSSARSRGSLGREVCMTLNKWEPGSFRLPGVRPGSVFAPDGGT
jgi:hypothetical protein